MGFSPRPRSTAYTVACDQVGGHWKAASRLQSPELTFLPPKSRELNGMKMATSVCDLGLALVPAQLMQITQGSQESSRRGAAACRPPKARGSCPRQEQDSWLLVGPRPRRREQAVFGVRVRSTKYSLEEKEGRKLLLCGCAFGRAQCIHLAYVSKYRGSSKTSREAVRRGGGNVKSVEETLENRCGFSLRHP